MAQIFKVGDRVEVTEPFCASRKELVGKRGTYIAEGGSVEFDEPIRAGHDAGGLGKEGYCYNGYDSELKLIKPETTIMKKLSNYYKKMTDADTQVLVEAGYLNGDLEPTHEAEQAIKEIQFFALKAQLVERAKEKLEAEKAEKKA